MITRSYKNTIYSFLTLLTVGVMTHGQSIKDAIYPVTDFGAKSDGVTLNTDALQAAIDACTRNGGGRVLITPGTFLTGTLFLKDNVELHLSQGATLLASTNIEDYSKDTFRQMYKNESHMDRCLIFVKDSVSVAITGQGTIDGQGAAFPDFPRETRNRPMMIRFLNSKNIRLRDVTLRSPASWTTAFLYCDDIVAEGLTIHSRANHNGDGLNFDGCTNVRVSNCAFDTSDDSICLQTSRTDRPIRNIVITNCVFSSQWAGMRIGLLSRGDFENVTVSNCIFTDTKDAGLKIQMNEGGTMQDMVFSNLVMHNVPRPIFMTFCQQRAAVDAPEEMAPMKAMRNFVFSSIMANSGMCDQHSAIVISGLPGHPIENIRMSNIELITGGGGSQAEGQRRELPEFTLETLKHWWPEYRLFEGAVPAHGLYARHVKGLSLNNVSIIPAKPDERPAIVCDNVEDMEMSAVRMQGNAAAESVIRLQDVRNAFIYGWSVKGHHRHFVAQEGQTDNIRIHPDWPQAVAKNDSRSAGCENNRQ